MEESGQVHPLRELIALAVHDLSNPLQSLSMLLELAQDDVAPGTEAHERLVEASRAGVAMRKLIRGLGDFNRSARAGEEVAASRLVSSTIGVLERRFERQGIELEDHSGGVGDTLVPADFQLLVLTLLLAGLSAEQQPGQPLAMTVTAPSPGSIQVELSTRGAQPGPWPLSPRHLSHAADLARELDVSLDGASSRATVTFA